MFSKFIRNGFLWVLVIIIATPTTVGQASASSVAPAWKQVAKSIALVGYWKAGVFVSYGTAFCIASSASTSEFLTTKHAVETSDPQAALRAVLGNSATPATIARTDSTLDLAIVSIAVGNVPTLKLSSSVPDLAESIGVAGFPYADAVRLSGIFGSGQMLANTEKAPLQPWILMGSVAGTTGQLIAFDTQGGAIDSGLLGAPLFDPESGVVYGIVSGVLAGNAAATDLALSASAALGFVTRESK
jgi:hypothetical protein